MAVEEGNEGTGPTGESSDTPPFKPDAPLNTGGGTPGADPQYGYVQLQPEMVETAPSELNFPNIPGEAEAWRNSDTGQVYIVVYVPNSDIPLIWDVQESGVEAFFRDVGGVDAAVGGNVYTSEQILNAGAIDGGLVSDIPPGSSPAMLDHPWDIFIKDFDAARIANPSLEDPEVLATHYMAFLEDRQVAPGELEATDYYRNSTAEQRDWMIFASMQPTDAARALDDATLGMADMLRSIGVKGVTDDTIRWMATQGMTGEWTGVYQAEQVRLLEMGETDGLDAELAGRITGVTSGSAMTSAVGAVREKIATWLGPAYAQHYSEKQINDWAADVAADPNALDSIVENLKDQRLGIFPNQDREMSYDALAAPWRQVYSSVLGQTADETDPMFEQLVKTNDRATNEALLRQHGFATNNAKVGQDMLGGLARASTNVIGAGNG